jgi:hypothetical protein
VLRVLAAALVNLVLLLIAALRAPFSLFGRRRPPVVVRFLLKGDPPYRQPLRRGWPWRRERHAPGQITSVHLFDEALETLAGDPR